MKSSPKIKGVLSFPHVFTSCCRIIFWTLFGADFRRVLKILSGLGRVLKETGVYQRKSASNFFGKQPDIFSGNPCAGRWKPENPEASTRLREEHDIAKLVR